MLQSKSTIKNNNNHLLRILNNMLQIRKAAEYYESSSILCIVLASTILVKLMPYTCFGNATCTNFISDIIISDFLHLLGLIGRILFFVLYEIKTIRFSNSPIIYSFSSVCSMIFSKKVLKTTKKLNKILKNIDSILKVAKISNIIISLLSILLFCHHEKLDDLKQHIDVINTIYKYLKKNKNPSIVPLLWLNDNDNFWDVGVGCESESIDQGRSYDQKNINISDCFFSRYLTYSGFGGVICVDGGSYSMSINYSMFYTCACSGDGGAIYFSSTNSYLRMICANRCSASYYNFAYLTASQENQMEYLSVSYCSNITSGYWSIRIGSGNQRVDNTNSSMNNAFYGSGILIFSPSSNSGSYCTYSNNNVSQSICISFDSGSGSIAMSYANIVQNNSPSQYGVLYIEGVGTRKMMYCIFHNNQNYLFCIASGSLEVSHSFIDHSGSLSTSIAVSTSNNNSFTNRITYQLQFFNSHHCNADIPLIDIAPEITLEKSPIRSLEETIRITNERTIDQTMRETLDDTPYRTYAEFICTNQMANWREISVLFSFLYISYIQ